MEATALGAAPLAILFVTAFLTAILSAIVGMAGGMTLLGVMLVFLAPLEAIPLHGAIQLASNFSRTLIQREHARYDLLWRYGLPLLPMRKASRRWFVSQRSAASSSNSEQRAESAEQQLVIFDPERAE